MIEVEKVPSEKVFVSLITLTNASGASVALSSLGAGIAAVNVPDRDNCLGNVVAYYVPDAKEKIWDFEIIGDDEVLFTCDLPLKHSVSYRWTEDNVLEIYFHRGKSTAWSTNILGQTYFNLDGNQEALLDEYLWINSLGCPDFSKATKLSNTLKKSEGFSHCWQLRDWQPDVMNDAAVLASHRCGRQLNIHTSFPTLKVELPVSFSTLNVKLPTSFPTPKEPVPSSHIGISFSTIPHTSHSATEPHTSAPQQTTFLHFSLL